MPPEVSSFDVGYRRSALLLFPLVRALAERVRPRESNQVSARNCRSSERTFSPRFNRHVVKIGDLSERGRLY